MDFSVLGPVEVRLRETALAVGSGRERFVLAMLLLNAGRLTPASVLIDALWTDPPPSAKAQVHNIISNLRRRLESEPQGLITSRPLGYELHLDSHTLDLVEFRRLSARARLAAEQGDQALAWALFGEALALWRGPALADVPDELAGGVRHVLNEERLAAAESKLDIGIETGRFDEVLAEASALTAEQPYREKLWLARILALAGAERRVEALETYQQVRRRFIDELGVEPGPQLRWLERRILRGDFGPAAATAEPVRPGQLPPPTAIAVTGRDKLIGEIRAELGVAGPDAVGGKVLVLVGPGGVGKTTLALTVAHEARELFGNGQLYADLRGSRADPADPHEVVGRFLRALGVDGAQLPDDPQERIARYRSHLAGTRTLVVLDDAASEQQVRPLLPGDPACTVVVTSRRMLAALIGGTRWTVPVLESADATELLRRIVGSARVDAELEAAADIADLCGQLPLAVCVAAARLAVHPDWTLSEFRSHLAAERQRLDELSVGDLDVRASIGLSYRALDPQLQRLLRRLGMLTAPDWPAWVASEAIGGPVRVEPLLERLMDVHLVEPLGLDAVGQRRFRLHDLIAEFAYERALLEETERDRSGAIVRVLSGWLALATDADRRTGHGMIPATGLPAPRPPAGAPVADIESNPLEWLEAERFSLVAAVQQACGDGHAALAGALALRLSGFLAMRAHKDDGLNTLRSAIAAVREAGQGFDELLIRLLGALFAASLGRSRSPDLPAIAAEELALARRLGERQAEIGALANLGWAARRRGRLFEAAEWLEQALAAADEQTPTRLRTRAMQGLALVYREAGRYPLAVPLTEQALAIERRQGRPRITAMCLINHASALADVGRLDEAERALAEAVEVHGDLTSTDIAFARADIDRRRHRWDEAASRLDQWLAFAEEHGDHHGVAEALCALADVAVGRGRPEDAIAPLRRAVAVWRRLGSALELARALARLDRALTACHASHGDETQIRREWQGILADLGLDEASLRIS